MPNFGKSSFLLCIVIILLALCFCTFAGVDSFDTTPKNKPMSKPPKVAEPKGSGGMVRISSGTFMMGCLQEDSACENDEKPAHQVTVNSFWMDRTEVTNADYQKCVSAKACSGIDETSCMKFEGSTYKRGGSLDQRFIAVNLPVVCVSWEQARQYCQWAGKRLPTEAEWEYAARAGTTTKYGCGDDPSCLNATSWFAGNSENITHAVAQKQPNDWGLYDMLGNAWEWTADWYSADYYSFSPSDNPKGHLSGSSRALRGGSWIRNFNDLRISNRGLNSPSEGFNGIGFRCARDS